jgi:hypothetical protein
LRAAVELEVIVEEIGIEGLIEEEVVVGSETLWRN